MQKPTPANGHARPRAAHQDKPARFLYALKAFTAEIRSDGWWIARTPFSSQGERPEWAGPFETIESASLAIARRLATEIADRHTRAVETHHIKSGQPLYGLKATTRSHQSKGTKATTA